MIPHIIRGTRSGGSLRREHPAGSRGVGAGKVPGGGLLNPEA